MADMVAAAFCLSMGEIEELVAPARFLPGPRPLDRLFLRFLVLVVEEFELLVLWLWLDVEEDGGLGRLLDDWAVDDVPLAPLDLGPLAPTFFFVLLFPPVFVPAFAPAPSAPVYI